MQRIGVTDYTILGTVKGAELELVRFTHPFMGFDVPAILGDHVTRMPVPVPFTPRLPRPGRLCDRSEIRPGKPLTRLARTALICRALIRRWMARTSYSDSVNCHTQPISAIFDYKDLRFEPPSNRISPAGQTSVDRLLQLSQGQAVEGQSAVARLTGEKKNHPGAQYANRLSPRIANNHPATQQTLFELGSGAKERNAINVSYLTALGTPGFTLMLPARMLCGIVSDNNFTQKQLCPSPARCTRGPAEPAKRGPWLEPGLVIRKDGLRTGKLLSSLRGLCLTVLRFQPTVPCFCRLALSSSVAISSTGLVNFSR
uniref:Beta-lactamase n=1 Tax=Burkholderia multivorans (strain ATCC 17616 / 249) TaxID=395019 RepID=PENA_BURM1|nr:RecName: Full=Beta-lactamase; AltName: Full=Penicillinase; Flags: Precursor [Burkholderia multivorans ATCC 17616]AAA25927.1 penA [Burkholderia cepacia]